MINMKSLLALLITCCLGWSAQAATVQVSGRVFFGSSLETVANYPIWVYSENGRTSLFTNEDGSYQASVEAVLSENGFAKVTVETFDICSAQLHTIILGVSSDSTNFANVDFKVCVGVRPPSNGGCGAFFMNESNSDDPLTVHFRDLSYSGMPITNWYWNFGDGATSTDQNPTHTYVQSGIYTVTLRILAVQDITSETPDTSCVSSFSYTIIVGNFDQCNCLAIYDPVCVATPSGGFITFPNKCIALCEGYDENILTTCPNPDCVCPAVYDPVCVLLDNGDVVQFGNACEAACQGYSREDFVDCDSGGCVCPEIYDPVCVVVNGDTLTYSNACFAECAGFDSTDFIECRPNDCICPPVYDPVCIKLADGNIISYNSRCEALCNGFKESDIVPCASECDCPTDEYDPVCVIMPDGSIKEFVSPCYAKCNGFTPDDFVECDTSCICPEYYDPVCAVVNGDTLEFANICFATCAGFSGDQLFTCNPQTDCLCTLEYNPVCVVSPSGDIIEFANACAAECAGYTEDDFIECSSDCHCPLEIYEPVCAISADGDTLRFNNRCLASCAGFSEDELFFCTPPNDDCLCPLIYDPVCVLNGDTVLIKFPNPCVAECNGFSSEDFVDCNNTCVCPEYYDPVCVVVNGDTITYGNACFAACDGYGADDLIRCNNNEPRDCYADFFVKRASEASLEITFIDNSYTPIRTFESWHWNFGDGTTAEGQTVTHTYAEPGMYQVTLTVMSADSCSARTIREIYIREDDVVTGPDCRALFLFRQDSNNPRTFKFNDLSLGEAISWHWDFGDGATSNEQNPTHTFAYDGVFYVQLITRTPNCESRTSMIVYVDPNAVYDNECNALFIPLLYVDSLQIFFRNMSSTDAIEYFWDFGDGATSTRRDPEHTYREMGIYEISLTITTADGCTNTFTGTINLTSQHFTGAPAYLETTDTDEAQAFAEFKLYPNPVNETLRLEFGMPASGAYQLSIFSLEGKLLRTSKHEAFTGKNNVQISVGELPPGMYLLRIQSHEHSKMVKFVKS